MLDARNRVLWTWSTHGPPLTDRPVIDSSGTIYVIAYDLIWVALDLTTGKVKWRGTAVGRAVYSQIELYNKDEYLVVTNMQGYRDNLSDSAIQDKLTLCKGNAILWETDIPADASIEVKGRRVFAVIEHRKQIERQEIAIPRNLRKPIGKVSMLAGSDQ